MLLIRRLSALAVLTLVHPASAGEVVKYAPRPEWVVPAAAIDPVKLAADSPALLLFDNQQRLSDGTTWSYSETATRAATAESVGQLATIALPWYPDKGDLVIHKLAILRGKQVIDLVAAGQKFTTIRREGGLEQQQLDGMLTATLAVEGLQVGDVLNLAFSQSLRDPALNGRTQTIAPVLADPVRVGSARLRLSWPAGDRALWKTFASGVKSTDKTAGGYRTIEIALPAPKQAELPTDSPARFARPPLVEVSTFSGWDDVSSTMAPLYATEGLIKAGGDLDREVSAIARETADPLRRTERALRVVQDKVRYFAVFMNGGNYQPQSPEKTWSVRYGDCKAKTLLLLAMLHKLGIEADAVLASVQTTEFVTERLPSALAFDHILVRGKVGGETLWLDGTASGTRLADLRDTPPFRVVLPVQAGKAVLTPIAVRPAARPIVEAEFDIDESQSVDLPLVARVKIALRGAIASALNANLAQLATKDRVELASRMLHPYLGTAQIGDVAIANDAEDGTLTIVADAVVTNLWNRTDIREERNLSAVTGSMAFAPDRARAAWAAIPVAARPIGAIAVKTRVRLPDRGEGYTLEGDPAVDLKVAGYRLSRKASVANGIATVEERLDQTGEEIPAASVASERQRFTALVDRPLRIVAPSTASRRWQVDRKGGTQLAAVEAVFAKAIARDPDEPTGFDSRSSVRAGVLDWEAAIADIGKAIALQPSVSYYRRRAEMYEIVGKRPLALKDAEAAYALEPSSPEAVTLLAELRQRSGDGAGALALVEPLLAAGGESYATYTELQAGLLADEGRTDAALALLDSAMVRKPGLPLLLNARCWIKGTRNVALDTALKDCTRAIELSDDPTAAMDSRAMVYFRLGRYDEALAEVDAVLARAPNIVSTRYLRSLILAKLGRTADAQTEAALARRLQPLVDEEFSRYGLKYTS